MATRPKKRKPLRGTFTPARKGGGTRTITFTGEGRSKGRTATATTKTHPSGR